MKLLPIYFFLLAAVSVLAQPISSHKLDDLYKVADETVETGDYYNALEWYKEIYEQEKSIDVALSIGYTYYKMRDFQNAERWYTRALENDLDNIFVDDRYAYGRVLRAIGENLKAKEELEKFMALSDDEALLELAKIELDGIATQNQHSENEDIVIQFGGDKINSGNGDYSPRQFDDNTLYFSSFNTRREVVLDGNQKNYHAKIYKSTKEEGQYGKPEELSRQINRDEFHVGGVCFSADRRTMYFSRQRLEHDQIFYSAIYRSRMNGDGEWGAAEPVPGINLENTRTLQPSSGELFGQEVLFFVSDREGGEGGMDIYYATVSGNNFSAPVNLGNKINTKYDDLSPSYHEGKMFFSTAGRPGMGYLDIFSSEWNGKAWAEAQNMGKQFNTPFDDYGFVYNQDGIGGFLVSNRPDEQKAKYKSETCCYDIYTFDVRQLDINLLVGVGTMDEKPLQGATVELIDQLTDDLESQTQEKEYRFNFDLLPERNYTIITSKEGYYPDTSTVSTGGVTEDKSIRKKVLLREDPNFGKDIAIDGSDQTGYRDGSGNQISYDTIAINEPIRMNNIYYDFDKWNILTDAEVDLNIILDLMNEYPAMVVELASHTDSRGTIPYNEELSQKRADSAKKWLTQRGISEKRIKAIGYGESQILNRCVNGVRCSDDEHRFNRRTEFKIIEGPQTITIKRVIINKDTSGGKQSAAPQITYPKITYPKITFEQNNLDIGKMKEGDKKEIVFDFTNTGTSDLVIDLATACKCTEIDWPKYAISPGEKGRIVAIFDSSDMEGEYTKTIDIIANTDPIVVEAKFSVVVVREP